MENKILNLPEGQEEMAWLMMGGHLARTRPIRDGMVDDGWSFSTNVPTRTARDTINILRDHYSWRLAMSEFKKLWKMEDNTCWSHMKFIKNTDHLIIKSAPNPLKQEHGIKGLTKNDE
nr:hypothetical protein [Tanacetum cinerariifolium]